MKFLTLSSIKWQSLYILCIVFCITIPIQCYGNNLNLPAVHKPVNKSNIRPPRAVIGQDDYPLNNVTSKVVHIEAKSSVEVSVSGVNRSIADFLVFQVHSDLRLILSYNSDISDGMFANATNPGLVLRVSKKNDIPGMPIRIRAFVRNDYRKALSVLVIVRNYTDLEPVPGNSSNVAFPKPFLKVDQNLLTTWVTIPAASSLNTSVVSAQISDRTPCNSDIEDGSNRTICESLIIYPHYEVYLTYMYEGDMSEGSYWEKVIITSDVEELPRNSKKVAEFTPSSDEPEYKLLFVSYTGVGAVVTVSVSYNDSVGALYSTTVFYGCDFRPEEKYSCTKLASAFSGLFCASLLFLGPILLFLGHRWLNFTMFFSGSFFGWFLLFVVFIHVPHANVPALGVCTLLGSLLVGTGWLLMWHKVHRPFFSALLIIVMCGFFVAMISTHFLKYAVVPTHDNIAAFIVFPILFCLATIAYSIKDIKQVHIFACSLLGSYCFVVPFAFYFGSSLTYIVINIVSVVSVPHFSEAIGYPPFQYSDVALLCIWILLFLSGMTYQLLREKSSPPFHPPNTESWEATKSFCVFVKEKLSAVFSCRSAEDNESVFEDQPNIFTRFKSSFKRCFQCQREEVVSGYESFPRIGPEMGGESVWTRISSQFHQIKDRILIRVQRDRPRTESDGSIRRAILTEEGNVSSIEGNVSPSEENFSSINGNVSSIKGNAKNAELDDDAGDCNFTKSKVVLHGQTSFR